MRFVFHCREYGLLSDHVLTHLKNYKKSGINNYDKDKPLNLIYQDQQNSYYFMESGKKKKIAIQSMHGFNRIFNSSNEIKFFNLDYYDNNYLKIATLLVKIGILNNLKEYYIKRGYAKITEELQQNINIFLDWRRK